MDHATYCRTVCGAKCCKHHLTGIDCPQLAEDKSCKCYAERFADGMGDLVFVGRVEINETQGIDFLCGRIANLIKAKALPEDVEAGCCFAHPELLQRDL